MISLWLTFRLVYDIQGKAAESHDQGLCATIPSRRWRLVIGSPSIDPVTCRRETGGGGIHKGFSLLEMMMVITLILIVVSIAQPIYHTAVVRAREAVLRDHLYTLRYLIDRFTVDMGRSPRHLAELVEKGYLGRLPTDPFTGSNQTWQEIEEKAAPSPMQTYLGVGVVHSGSEEISLEGTPYNSW